MPPETEQSPAALKNLDAEIQSMLLSYGTNTEEYFSESTISISNLILPKNAIDAGEFMETTQKSEHEYLSVNALIDDTEKGISAIEKQIESTHDDQLRRLLRSELNRALERLRVQRLESDLRFNQLWERTRSVHIIDGEDFRRRLHDLLERRLAVALGIQKTKAAAMIEKRDKTPMDESTIQADAA